MTDLTMLPAIARIFAVMCGLLIAASAQAAPPQVTTGGTNTPTNPVAATVGTSAAQLVGAATPPITTLAIDNESASANIAICFVPLGSSSCTPALNTAGSFTIPAGTTRTWGVSNGNVPPNAIYAISSAAGTPITVERE